MPVLTAAVQEEHDGTITVVGVVLGGKGDPVSGPDPMLHDRSHDALPTVLTIVTVPCAAHTALSPLVMSMRATPLRLPSDTMSVTATHTPLRLPSDTMSATATHTPLDTGLSRFNLNSVVATYDPAGMTG